MIKQLTILIFFALTSLNLCAQQIDSSNVLITADQMPEFIGGYNELMRFISNNIKYPNQAKESGVQGTVYLKFIIDKEGKLKEPVIIRSLKKMKIDEIETDKAKKEALEYNQGVSDIEKECLRIITALPDWKPGLQNGKPVSVYFTLPIKFNLK